jgi:putative membrane protein insertion efficiency factor
MSAPRRAAVALLGGYKRWVSPLLPAACRFEPSCSSYAREAIERHGLPRGSWLAVLRLARCHPLARGGWDPVPPRHGHAPQAGRGPRPGTVR